MSRRNNNRTTTSTVEDFLSSDSLQQAKSLKQFQALRTRLQEAIQRLAVIAEQRDLSYEESTDGFGSESVLIRPLAEVLQQRSTRLDEPFRMAVVGEFSRGKSSLINALLKRELLTSDSRPNTASQTILKHGSPERFMVTFLPETGYSTQTHVSDNLQADIASFTSDASVHGEEEQPSQSTYEEILKGQRKSLAEEIEKVEVWLNNDLLRQMEIEIIDTPGLGAVFKTHEQVTLRVMHSVDAIIFAIQIDPGVDGREVAFLRLIREHVPKIFFAVTKSDWIPDKQELAERIEYLTQTIHIKADIEVQHIFPVSSWLAMEDEYEKSGFSLFLPALEQFLVRSNGVHRLLAPLRFTRTQTRHVLKLLDDYLQRLDQSQEELEMQLQDLNAEAKRIHVAQEELLDFVDGRINGIISTTLDTIEELPTQIRQKVEREIYALSANDLRQANVFIQAAIKEAIAGWLEQRKANFATEIRLLNSRVKQDLTELLKNLQFDEEQISLIRSIAMEIDVPIDTSNITDDIGDRVMRSLLSMGISDTIASVASSLVQIASSVLGAIKRGISRLFGRKTQQPQDNQQEVRERLCAALLQNISGSTVNTYYAVVEGYQQYGRSVDGVHQVIKKAFTEWGRDMENDISSLVSNNLNTRLHDLTSQLEARRSGLQENVVEKARIQAQQVELTEILKSIASIQKRLNKLGVHQDD